MFLLTHQMLWWCLTLWHKVHSFSHYVCSGTFSIVISFGLPFLVDIPLRKLKQILHKLKLQSFLGNGCEIDVSYVRGVRDWKGWLLGYALCFESPKFAVSFPINMLPQDETSWYQLSWGSSRWLLWHAFVSFLQEKRLEKLCSDQCHVNVCFE